MKIAITGGHITPALAVLEELQKKKDTQVVVIGRRQALDSEKTVSFEYEEVRKHNIEFIDLKAGRLTRAISLQSLINLLLFPVGFIGSFFILTQTRPQVVLSFGGYIALPVSVVAYLLGIPVFTHEQTMLSGVTNKIISHFCKKVFVSYEESARDFPTNKVEVTGNPVRSAILEGTKKLFTPSDRPVIYITGGSLGSHSINVHIEAILDTLLKKFTVIHQIGNVAQYGDWDRLSMRKSEYYYPVKHVTEDEIGWIYSVTDLVVSRSGANTVSELIVSGLPAILIPLPWSGGGEQRAQAAFLKEAGVAVMFEQDQKSEDLLSTIESVYENRSQYKKMYSNLSAQKELILSASKKIADGISSV